MNRGELVSTVGVNSLSAIFASGVSTGEVLTFGLDLR